eukprot:241199-Rhodomonas_salina.1
MGIMIRSGMGSGAAEKQEECIGSGGRNPSLSSNSPAVAAEEKHALALACRGAARHSERHRHQNHTDRKVKETNPRCHDFASLIVGFVRVRRD